MAEFRDIQNVKELIICPICLDSLKNPKKLPCRHSFCLVCLTQHIRSKRTPKKTFTCPNCRKLIGFEDASCTDKEVAESFPNNSLLDDIRRKLQAHESSVATCKNHPESPAEYLCLPHAVFLCGRCAVKSHRESKCNVLAVSEATENLQTEIRKLKEQNEKSINETQNMLTPDFKQNHLEAVKKSTLNDIQDFENRIGVVYQDILKDIDKAKKELRDIRLPNSYDSSILELLNKWEVEKIHLENMKTDSDIPASFNALDEMKKAHTIVNDGMKTITYSVLVKNDKVKDLLNLRGSVVHMDKDFNNRYKIGFKKEAPGRCVIQ